MEARIEADPELEHTEEAAQVESIIEWNQTGIKLVLDSRFSMFSDAGPCIRCYFTYLAGLAHVARFLRLPWRQDGPDVLVLEDGLE